MTKQQILAGYLNDAYFDSNAYGIEAAAETYFNTTAAKLTLLQAATLAGIVEDPTAYDPYTNPAAALQRRNTVLAAIAQVRADGPGRRRRGHVRAREAGAARRRRAERLHRQHGRRGRLLLRLRDARAAAGQDPRGDHRGPGQAARHRRPEGLHHAEREGPGRGDPGRQLRAAQELQDLQPGAQRRHRGPGPAGHGRDQGDRRGPPLRHRQAARPCSTTRSTAQYGGGAGVQTGSSSKLFTLITALEHGRAVRLPAHGARQRRR